MIITVVVAVLCWVWIATIGMTFVTNRHTYEAETIIELIPEVSVALWRDLRERMKRSYAILSIIGIVLALLPIILLICIFTYIILIPVDALAKAIVFLANKK